MATIYDDVLYSKSEAFFEALCVESETGEIDEAKEAELNQLQLQIAQEGMEKLCKVRANKMAYIEALREEEKRIADKRHIAENALSRFESYIQSVLHASGQPKIQAGTFTIGTRKSVAVVVDDAFCNPEYIKVEYAPDKIKLKNDLKAGKEIDGAHLVERESLAIK